MKVTSAQALQTGEFTVVFDSAKTPVVLSSIGESEEHHALAAWFMAGNKATAFTPELSDLIDRAKATIQAEASAVVLAIGGNPSADEIASWPEKVTASKAALAGQDFDAVMLASTMQDHGVDAIGAAQIILLRARLYRLAKAAAEIIANGAKQGVGVASDQDGITVALEGFRAALATRQQQFGQIALAAKSGDLAPLEAAEAEIIGS